MLRPITTSLLLTVALLAVPAASLAQEIGFWEDFALASDREPALKQLIPGTEDYYYFHGLHYQNTEQFERADALLKLWLERHGRTKRFIEIETRQSLLVYGIDPKRTLDYVQSELNLRFDHQRQSTDQKPNLPTVFDNQNLDRDRLFQRAIRRNNLTGFEASADQWLVSRQLTPELRRMLLQRLERPDLAGLVALVDDDLKHPRSGGFGSLPIHRHLLRSQLDDLAKRQPQLLNQSPFVRTYLTKLAPGADTNEKYDQQAKIAHLERLWNFVRDLGPVHNSLKAHVLFRRLAWDRAQGIFDRERFETYLKLPRNAPYVNPEYLQRPDLRAYVCNLGESFPESGLPNVGNDEPLVRSYFLHFLAMDTDYKQYLPLARTEYLKEAFAEAKIVNHIGNPEQWAALLSPAKFQQLRDRVDLDFVETNRRLYSIGDKTPVSLDMHVKNVRTLLIKVFRINTEAFYRDNGSDVNTNIELDGLVPNWQRTVEFDNPPLDRVRRHFEFPELSEPGVYVVDFLGNGRSSRAVIQKGQLRIIDEVTPNGQLLTVLDDNQEVVRDASILLGGKIYKAEKDGRVLAPLATQPGTKPIVIFRESQAFLGHLHHQGEDYSLRAGIYIDKEALLSRREGRMLIRPQLRLNGIPISVEDLEDVQLGIASRDLDGIVSSQHVPNLKLRDDLATEHVFTTPPRTAAIEVTLTAKIKRVSQVGEPVSLSVSKSIVVNNFDETKLVGDLHLAWIDNRYVVLLLGRSGEALQDRAVRVSLKHRDFTEPVIANLKTNEGGEVELGPLRDVAQIFVRHGELTRQWTLQRDGATMPSLVHGVEGRPIQIPLPQSIPVDAQHVSLLETRGGQFVSDAVKHVKRDGGLLTIDLPAGDYNLMLKGATRHQVTLRVAKGPLRTGYACSDARLLEIRNPRPIGIRDVQVANGKLNIQVQNGGGFARVHILGTRLIPTFDCLGELAAATDILPQHVSISRRPSLFAEGRQIGDEYRYILERQLGQTFPGNMLERPSLLLNPWALRSTEASNQDAQRGEQFSPTMTPPADSANRPSGPGSRQQQQAPQAANLDFLAMPAVVVANLPVKDGQVTVDLKALGDAQQIRVIAADAWGIVQRSVSLPRTQWASLDLRLADSLPPLRHFVQRQQTSILEAEQSLTLDASATRMRVHDSLDSVYQLLTSLNPDQRLQEFRFVLQWPTYDEQRKRELYSKYASHELNFFLAHKDPEFFKSVVAPHIAHKRDKTFMDDFLLGNDVLPYTDAWSHDRLNVVERILVGRQLRAHTAAAERHVQELYELVPPNPNTSNTCLRVRSTAPGSIQAPRLVLAWMPTAIRAPIWT